MGRERQRQVLGSGDSGLIIESRSPMAGAMGSLGENLGNIGNDYLRKMAREDAEADIAKEQNRSAESWANAELAMKQMQDPKEIVSFYEEWEAGEKDAVNSLGGNRLAKRAIGMQSDRRLTQSRIKTQGAGGYVDAAYINKNMGVWENQKQNAVMGIVPEGFDSPQAAFNFAVDKQVGLDPRMGVTAEVEKSKFMSTSNSAKTREELSSMAESYISGDVSHSEFINALEEKREQINSKDYLMEDPVRQRYNAEISSKIMGAKTKKEDERNQVAFSVLSKAGDMNFEAEEYYQMMGRYGEEYAPIILANAQRGLEIASSKYEDAELAFDIAGSFVKGKKTLEASYKELSELDGSAGYMASLMIASSMGEMDSVAAYDTNFFGKDANVEIKGAMSEAITAVQTYLKAGGMSGEDAGIFLKKMSKFYEKNENPSDEDVREFHAKVFKAPAMKAISRHYKPVVKDQSTNFDVVKKAYPDWDDAKINRYLEYKGLNDG